jgi:hypothetical protein
VFETLREDDGFAFYRGRTDEGELPTVLSLAPVSEHPVPAVLERLEHEYSLRDELDSDWAARPLTLVRREGRPTLILRDSGGEPLDRLLGQPMVSRSASASRTKASFPSLQADRRRHAGTVSDLRKMSAAATCPEDKKCSQCRRRKNDRYADQFIYRCNKRTGGQGINFFELPRGVSQRDCLQERRQAARNAPSVPTTLQSTVRVRAVACGQQEIRL